MVFTQLTAGRGSALHNRMISDMSVCIDYSVHASWSLLAQQCGRVSILENENVKMGYNDLSRHCWGVRQCVKIKLNTTLHRFSFSQSGESTWNQTSKISQIKTSSSSLPLKEGSQVVVHFARCLQAALITQCLQ